MHIWPKIRLIWFNLILCFILQFDSIVNLLNALKCDMKKKLKKKLERKLFLFLLFFSFLSFLVHGQPIFNFDNLFLYNNFNKNIKLDKDFNWSSEQFREWIIKREISILWWIVKIIIIYKTNEYLLSSKKENLISIELIYRTTYIFWMHTKRRH